MENSESIKNLIECLQDNSVVLPEFQRDFVWSIEKTFDLFDSLAKNIFIGAIIYGKPSFQITVRDIDDRSRLGKKKKIKTYSFTKEEIDAKVKIENFRLILDGQQRVTSLYRALKGIDDVWFIVKNDDELTDEISSIKFEQRTLEQLLYEISGQQDSTRLSVKFSDVYDIMNNSFRERHIKQKYFDVLNYPKEFEDEINEELFSYYLLLTSKIQDLYKAEKLLNYYLLDMSLDKFALFFERSNSRGIQLNFIDILAAKLYIGFNLREEVEKFEEEYPKYAPLDKEIIVRSIAYIISEGKDIDRTFILTQLDHNHFKNYWNDILSCYKRTLDFLYDNNFIISQSWLPYENMLVPLIIFIFETKGNYSQITEYQKKFIDFWYWSAIFALRYSGASNEAIIQDANQLRRIAKNEKISEKSFLARLFKYQITSFDDIYSFNKKSSAIYKGILNLINQFSNGLQGWQNTAKLPFNEKIDDHHIFPRSFITIQYRDDDHAQDLLDCVANKTLIPKLLNISIGSKAPSQYLNEIKNRDNPKLEDCLSNHLINLEILSGLYDEFFVDFIEERAKQIFEIINNRVISISKKIQEEYYEEPIKGKSLNIKVFAKYINKQFEATFNPLTQKILFKGKEYSVSTAASKVKEEVRGRSDLTANGWIFWKFMDDNGDEKYIEEYRKNY
jgi:hypothetical protein